MNYEEFVRLRDEGKVRLGITHSNALGLVKYLPKKYQLATYFWSLVCILSIPFFILIAILYKWWVGLILLVFITPLIWKAIKRSAAEFVIEHASRDSDFFNLLVENDILTVEKIYE